MRLERRYSSRSTVQPPAYAWLGSKGETTVLVLNVSDYGIGILGSSAIKSKSDVELRIMLDLNADTFNAKGKIAWADDTGEAGIHLQLQEWQEYAQQWRSLSARSVSAAQPLAPPATSAMLPSAPQQLQPVRGSDDERVVAQLRGCCLRGLEADLEAKRVRRVRTKGLAAIALAGLFCGATVWLLMGRSSLLSPVLTRPSNATQSPQPTVSSTAAAGSSVSPQPAAAAVSSPVVDAQSRAASLEVLPGITYESSPDLVRFVIDLREQLDLHVLALTNPDRIYFDVPTSAVSIEHRSVNMSDDLVRRIRVSSRGGGVTRIVLDLKCSCTYRFQLSSSPRHRVQIEVWPRSVTRLPNRGRGM